MTNVYKILQWFGILSEYFNGTIYFSNNGGTIAKVPLSVSNDDLTSGWGSLFIRLKTEIPIVVEAQSPIEDWQGFYLYNANGTALADTKELSMYDQQCLYVVPKNRYFYWPYVHLGHRAYIKNPNYEKTVVLESLSESPRIFLIHDLMDMDEADFLINNSLSIHDSVAGMHRSTTGDGTEGDDPKRTSQNAWDSTTEVSIALHHRMFFLLGMPYLPDNMDGLQIVRYQQKEAYFYHNDYYELGSEGSVNLDPSSGGTNRYATIFVYLNDVEEGGQTVFTKRDRVSDDDLNRLHPELAEYLNSSKNFSKALPKIENLFQPDSWQDLMTRKCYNGFSVKPKKTKAVLFYTVTPDWKIDPMTEHGGCPVLSGTKWGGNAWIWSDKRFDRQPGYETTIGVKFTNMLEKTGSLWWKHIELVSMVPGETTDHTTYNTHEFRFEVDGVPVWNHIIDASAGRHQEWNIEKQIVHQEV